MRAALKAVIFNNGWRIVANPSQSLSAELLTDPGFEAGVGSWTALNSATITNPAGTRTGGAGSKVMRVAYNSVNTPGAYQASIGASGNVRRLTGWAKGDGTFAPNLLFPGSGGSIQALTTSTSWQNFDLIYVVDLNRSAIYANGASSSGFSEFDDVSETNITVNPQLAAQSPNMRITQYYTLAGSPVVGTQIWVMPRISSFSSGNYWLALLTFSTSSQWNINLYSVASGTRTSRTSATNIGATNGIRVNCNGDLLDLQTTADGGANWTTRGSQVNNSLYNTALGANTIYSPNNTIGNLIVEPAA